MTIRRDYRCCPDAQYHVVRLPEVWRETPFYLLDSIGIVGGTVIADVKDKRHVVKKISRSIPVMFLELEQFNKRIMR